MITASELTERLVFQKVASVGESDKGARTPVYEDFKCVWGNVKVQGAGERLRAEKLTPQKRVLIRVRYINGLENDMRVFHKKENKYYKIDSFDNVQFANKVHEIIGVHDASS